MVRLPMSPLALLATVCHKAAARAGRELRDNWAPITSGAVAAKPGKKVKVKHDVIFFEPSGTKLVKWERWIDTQIINVAISLTLGRSPVDSPLTLALCSALRL